MEAGLDIGKTSYKQAKEELGRRIREAREDNGLTQCDVAKALSISQSSYSRMEAGLIAPDCAQIRVLSGLHGVSILWLLGMPNYFVYALQSSSPPSSF